MTTVSSDEDPMGVAEVVGLPVKRVEFREILVCDDCTIAIANDDYSGMNDATEALVRAGTRRITR